MWFMWNKFVCKHSEIIADMFKISLLYRQITREFLVLRMRNFQGIAFVWTQTYSEILKSALVQLNQSDQRNDRLRLS